MKLLSISNAKAIWLFSTLDMNPRGHSIEGLLEAIQERYKFKIMPTLAQLHEFNTKKQAIPFSMGEFEWSGGVASMAITYYADGLMVETRARTAAADECLSDLLEWLESDHSMNGVKSLSIRKIYSSEVYVTMAKNLTTINPKLERLVKLFAEKSQWPGSATPFQLTGITIGADPSYKGQHPVFKLERDIQAPFDESRYYSTAPLSTEEHLEFLEEMERILKG